MSSTTTLKTVNFRTNYNRKLDCPYFIHIDVAPQPGTVPQSVLDNTIVLIATIDGSHPPVRTKVMDLTRFPLKNLPDSFCLLSHGIDKTEYLKQMSEKKGISTETEMAVYYYQKVD